MKLLTLPSELLLTIAEALGPKDVNSFLRSSHYLSSLLTPLLHKLALQDKDGMSALSWASMNGYEPLVRLILANKGACDINAQDSTGYDFTALHRAAKKGHKAIVRLLLEHGAYVDVQGRFHQTPLVSCTYEVAQVLLNHGADVGPEPSMRDEASQSGVE